MEEPVFVALRQYAVGSVAHSSLAFLLFIFILKSSPPPLYYIPVYSPFPGFGMIAVSRYPLWEEYMGSLNMGFITNNAYSCFEVQHQCLRGRHQSAKAGRWRSSSLAVNTSFVSISVAKGLLVLSQLRMSCFVVHGGSGQCVRIRIVEVCQSNHRIGIEQGGGDRCRASQVPVPSAAAV